MQRRNFIRTLFASFAGFAFLPKVLGAKEPAKLPPPVRNSCLDKINVRTTINQIKTEIERTLEYFAFEPATQATANKFSRMAEVILNAHVVGGVIESFVIHKVDMTPTYLFARIQIQPRNEVEWVVLDCMSGYVA